MTYQDTLHALSEINRRQIFEILHAQPRSVAEIAKVMPISRPAVSQHLKILSNANLVCLTKFGNRHIYRTSDAGLQALRDYLNGFWTDVLSEYSSEIEKRKPHDRAG